jgi:acyl transferase domain-containing protein/phosphopantetheinyl transferase
MNRTELERKPRRAGANPSLEDIAIIGMACMFPQAPDLESFWRNILAKVDATSDPPPDAWDVEVAYDPSSRENDRVYCRRGGYLGPVAYFNPLEHGVMPRAAEGGDPDQWLALHVSKAALADAGYPEGPAEGRDVAVIVGKGNYITRGNSTMVQHGHAVDLVLKTLRKLHPEMSEPDLALIREDLKRDLPRFDAESAGALVPNILAGRIANRLDLMGPSYTVDAACASSLVAVDLAIRGLRDGEFSMALAGGAHVSTPFTLMSLFCQLGALSRSQCIRPFDAGADGTLMSEGIGMVVLKRRADAERDGDRIYAVIQGVGVASDGRAVSVLAPRVDGEELALRRAYESAGIDPATISLVEAHGTGTLVGDAVEMEALRHVFPGRGERLPWCALGTVKSMIGHTLPAAGMAGLIKVALSLYHKVLPATIHVSTPNPRLELERTPFYLNAETRPWIHRSDAPRRAGVNAFGFGGINAHLIVEEYAPGTEPPPIALPDRDSEVCILRGASRAELVAQAEPLRAQLDAGAERSLHEIARDLNLQDAPSSAAMALAIVASSVEDLGGKLQRAIERLAKPSCRQIKDLSGIYFSEAPLTREGKLAFLFPGEGAQFVNMLEDLCVHFPQVRRCFDEMDAVMAHRTRGGVPSQLVFPPPAFSDEERQAAERRLFQMESAIEAVITANHALYTLLSDLGIRPDAMVGHSTGEYSAMRAAAMLDEACYGDHLRRLNRLYETSSTEVPTDVTLLAVGAGRAKVEAVLADVSGELYVAMDNCPHQVVVVGERSAADRAVEELQRRGYLFEALRFDRGYHTPLFSRFSDTLRDFQNEWIVAPPRLPLYSCTSVAPFSNDLDDIRRISLDHWMRPVEFTRTIERMHADGVRLFVEVGPRGNLTAFIGDILGDRPHVAVAASVMRRSGIEQLNHLLAILAMHGVPMRMDALYERTAARRAVGAADAQRQSGRMKLATGFPAMEVSAETAGRLQSARASAQTPRAGSPPKGVSAPPAAPASPVDDPSIATPHAGNGSDRHARNGSALQDPPPNGPDGGAATDGADGVLSAYLRTMEQFLNVQQLVMTQALTGAADTHVPQVPQPRVAAATLPAVADTVASVAATPPASAERRPAVVAPPRPEPSAVRPVVKAPSVHAPVAGPARLDKSALQSVLLQLVAEKTGYPVEMLDVSADVEADLGIDSIKRIEILGAFQQKTAVNLRDRMEQVSSRKTLRDMIDVLGEIAAATEPARAASGPDSSAASRDAGDAVSIPPYPFLNELVSLTPGEELVALCHASVERYPFLRDHTFGREVSLTNPDLIGWTIMPLTMSMEILAEGGAMLMPGRRLVGMRDIRTHRWIALEVPLVSLRVSARRLAADEVLVQIREADAGDQSHPPATPVMEGVMIFAEQYENAPAGRPLTLKDEAPFRWPPDRLYEDLMFHGPSMQGVRSMNRVGTDGSEATLEVLPWDGMFADADPSALVTDGNLLDQVGQVVGFWAAQVPESPCLVPPFRLERLHLYGPPLPAHTKVTCQARTALLPDKLVRSELDVVTPDGHVWARLIGWENRRFTLPPSFYKYLLTTRDLYLSQPWDVPVQAGLGDCRARQLGLGHFHDGWFTSHGGFWRRVFAHLVLSGREREIWYAMQAPEPRRIEWLLGRMAAKDAVRHLLHQQYGLELCPADVEILPDEHGRPVVGGAWTTRLSAVPAVSISHSEGLAVALVGSADGGLTLGVDLERLDRMTDDVRALAFTSDEQHLLSSLRDEGDREWPLRFWCGKEAVAKALGGGTGQGPLGLVVRAADRDSGVLEVSATGDGCALSAHTARDGDLVVATSAITAQRSMVV